MKEEDSTQKGIYFFKLDPQNQMSYQFSNHTKMYNAEVRLLQWTPQLLRPYLFQMPLML